MSEENVEIVRQIYAAWGEGRSARDFIHEDVEYVNPPDAVEPGVLRGRASFRRIREVYPDLSLEPERFVDAGDEVVVIAVVRGRTTSGLETRWRQGYVWTIRDRKAVRFRWFNQPAEALEAVGLKE